MYELLLLKKASTLALSSCTYLYDFNGGSWYPVCEAGWFRTGQWWWCCSHIETRHIASPKDFLPPSTSSAKFSSGKRQRRANVNRLTYLVNRLDATSWPVFPLHHVSGAISGRIISGQSRSGVVLRRLALSPVRLWSNTTKFVQELQKKITSVEVLLAKLGWKGFQPIRSWHMFEDCFIQLGQLEMDDDSCGWPVKALAANDVAIIWKLLIGSFASISL